jgi:hypothetical protein
VKRVWPSRPMDYNFWNTGFESLSFLWYVCDMSLLYLRNAVAEGIRLSNNSVGYLLSILCVFSFIFQSLNIK